MTPLHFEQLYQAEWTELEMLVGRVLGREAKKRKEPREPVPGARLASLYRRACEHLALARDRSYPAYIVDRLERVTADAHQLIYQRRQFSIGHVLELVSFEFPSAVRTQLPYVMVSAAAFLVPTLVLGFLVYYRPDLILSVVSADTAESFERMYSPDVDSIGRIRTATTDWMMFGFYIRNNIGVAFQCFAGGLFAGLGSLFFLVFNGAFGGAVAGYLTNRGLSTTFYSFVATHSAFELTAIVLAGAAGMRIGHALLAPGRMTRSQSLVHATRETTVLLYGVTAMLVIAAAIEAFWSSATWLPPQVKYASALICWLSVLGYFTSQGRRAD
jgi:uncharacterized membrane protein SpoIIM required for sporulation